MSDDVYRYVSAEELLYQRVKLRQELQIVVTAMNVLTVPESLLCGQYPDVTRSDLVSSLLPRLERALEKTYVREIDSKEADSDVIEGTYMRAQCIAEARKLKEES